MKMRKMFAGFAAAAIALSLMTMSVGAEGTNEPSASANNYSGTITGAKTTTFDKFLVMKKDANVPNVEFGFNIAPGSSAAGSADKLSVREGVGTPTISEGTNSGKAVFAVTDDTVNEESKETADNVVFATATGDDEKYAKHTLTVDFSQVTFPEPGVYRYIITEQANATNAAHGITNDSEPARTLDVYVQDNDGALNIAGYIMYSGEVTEAPKKTATTPAATPNGAEAGTKSNSYTNKYSTNNLTVGKKVTGNHASKDKYFKFTVAITNAVAGTVYDVDLTHAFAGDIPADVNDATTGKTDAAGNPTEITVGNDGSATAVFWLQSGQYVTIQGLAQTTDYSVTEADYSEEGYTATAASSTDNDTQFSISDVNFDDDTTGTIDDADLATGFTNTRSGTIPTGVFLSVAGPAIIGIAAAGGLVFFTMKRKKEDAED